MIIITLIIRSVSLVLNSCVVKFDENTISTDIIIEEIEDIGFEASLVSLRKTSLLNKSSDNSLIPQNINKRNKYYIKPTQIDKNDIIVWSAQIIPNEAKENNINSNEYKNNNNEANTLNESYFYNIMNTVPGIIQILYIPGQNTSKLEITFNKIDILPMTISHHIQSNSNNLYTISEVDLQQKVIYDEENKDDISSEMKTIIFHTESFAKSFTTMRHRQIKQKFDKNITSIELDMDKNNLVIEYFNSTKSLHTARDIYKYLKHEMNFHDITTIDRMQSETDIYYVQQMKEVKKLRDSFIWSCIFGIPCFIITLICAKIQSVHDKILMYHIIPGNNSVTLMGILLFVLSTPVQFWIGKQFYISAYNAAKHGTSNMATLIVLG